LETLGPTEAHLWYVNQDDIADPDLILRYRALLSADETAQCERFATPRLRHEYLVTRALCRCTLSRYADVEPRVWRFARNGFGRPEISSPKTLAPLRFNLSNTCGLVVCLVTSAADAGVDVEDTSRCREPVSIADRFFSPSEVASIESLAAPLQRARFFEYWTLKEAYIKACGRGLSLPLHRFSFRLDEGKPITISFASEAEGRPGEWQFMILRPSERHVLAVAIRRNDRPQFRLELKSGLPAQGPSVT
jgi:4'-phosphopantetheinyl transferase